MDRRDPADAAARVEASIRAFVRRDLSILPAGAAVDAHTADDESAYVEHCDARLDRAGRLMSSVIFVFTLLWWPTDRFVAGHIPDTVRWMTVWRAVVAPAMGLHALWPRPSFISRHPGVPMLVLAVLCPMVMGWTAGCMGGPDRPWIHLLHVMVFSTMVFPLTMGRRVLVTALVSASTFTGFLLASPGHAAAPFFRLAVSFELCTFALSLAFGHTYWSLSRENFVQARQLARNAVALKGYSARLEDRVEHQADELQRLLRDVEVSREEERRKIAHELHDELGQELAALRYGLSFTRKRFGADPKAIGPNLASLDELVDRLATTTRQIVSSLRPRVLDDLGLCAALAWLVERSEGRMGVACQLAVEGSDAGVAQHCATAVFRVVQESLTNIAKHARASRVDVALRIADGRVSLTVRDDGVGFDRDRPPGGGLGLVGMRERAESLGGTFAVESRPGDGTTLRMEVPAAGH